MPADRDPIPQTCMRGAEATVWSRVLVEPDTHIRGLNRHVRSANFVSCVTVVATRCTAETLKCAQGCKRAPRPRGLHRAAARGAPAGTPTHRDAYARPEHESDVLYGGRARRGGVRFAGLARLATPRPRARSFCPAAKFGGGPTLRARTWDELPPQAAQRTLVSTGGERSPLRERGWKRANAE